MKIGDPVPAIVVVVFAITMMLLLGFWVGLGFWLAWRVVAA